MAAVKFTTTIEESWLAAFKRQAEKDGVPVGQWLALCGRERLPKRVAANLAKYTQRGEKKNGGTK